MADPVAATLTQLRNIQSKTGHSIAELHQALAASGLQRTGERRTWLMAQYKLGYGDANAVALFMDKPLPALGPVVASSAAADETNPDDAVAALYSGPKAALRPLHDAVMTLVHACGVCEVAPKKSYVSLRRKKQFAMLGPATKDSLELGLNIKTPVSSARLKVMPAGGMCHYTVRVSTLKEVDAEMKGWIATAFDGAG
jgi:hypothetical protein